MSTRHIVVLAASLAIGMQAVSSTMAAEPAITTYGERNPQAPDELEWFSFLVGKWSGSGRTRLEDGSYVDWDGSDLDRSLHPGRHGHSGRRPRTGPGWKAVSRHKLSGTSTPINDSWIVEFLNVSSSFLRRQVNPRSGFVRRDADSIAIIAEDAETQFRETYRVLDQSHFTYTAEASSDSGRTWGPVLFEMSFTRIE